MQHRKEVTYACQVNVVTTSKDFIQVEVVVEKNSQKIILIGKVCATKALRLKENDTQLALNLLTDPNKNSTLQVRKLYLQKGTKNLVQCNSKVGHLITDFYLFWMTFSYNIKLDHGTRLRNFLEMLRSLYQCGTKELADGILADTCLYQFC
ncbi:uncharacterized protein M6B38_264425 [Iris pallida]|uniref:Uncharacterized protein n=1 Tax=Iris pallida TaxID=29817 RepID=A0AAX6IB62_IRIPA|nr:uncharacterized protein M6B38_264425 [Iris pallida]